MKLSLSLQQGQSADIFARTNIQTLVISSHAKLRHIQCFHKHMHSYIYIHTYIYTYIIYICTHTYIHTYIHGRGAMLQCVHLFKNHIYVIHCIYIHIKVYVHTYHSFKYTYIHPYTLTHEFAHIRCPI